MDKGQGTCDSAPPLNRNVRLPPPISHRIHMSMNEYGNGVNLYRAAGELAGITSLVDAFYANVNGFLKPKLLGKCIPRIKPSRARN